MKKFIFTLAIGLTTLFGICGEVVGKRFSTAGFYTLNDTPRSVYSMNPSWLMSVGKVSEVDGKSAHSKDFNDSDWIAVNLPNGIEIVPLSASGGKNYQGEVWYRKHFILQPEVAGKRLVLYFEAVMGKSKIWMNGELLKEHFGGYTPIVIDITNHVKTGEDNVIAVLSDNSNDPIYPPGKPQDVLDFCYFGGIYRDVYLIETDKNNYITDANEVDIVAGGGVFAEVSKATKSEAVVSVKTDFVGQGRIEYTLRDSNGNVVYKGTKGDFVVKNPKLWTPDSPNLYDLEVRLIGSRGKVLDGLSKRIGLRTLEFTYKDGFILNGEAFPRKLIGANRHQDFAVVGNALSNSLHYRDAAKLKSAGMDIIRNAHYPQDPAFMDACDELGLFVIVNTPGWQFWNNEPIFEQRVYSDIRTMLRRDRNHPSVIMWEPILNETWYPEAFAKNVHDIVKQEIPLKGNNYTAADMEARGGHYFDIIFTHPSGEVGTEGPKELDTTKVYFTREWGDNVDDWNSHNSPSRVDRVWGEQAQLIQAIHYAKPNYKHTSYDVLQNTPNFHIGGTLWHSFDHQRGYHPDTFYGGVMTAFRRPKTSYYMFQGQSKEVQPMVYIANEMTPFSNNDVVVFSNCDSVRMRTFVGDSIRTKKCTDRWVVFENAWDFMTDKALSRGGKQKQAYILVEGLDANGNVVATHTRSMSRRPAKLHIEVDTMNLAMVANGGDLVVVTAQMVDEWGQIKRLNNEEIKFTIEGEGRLIGSPETLTNPVAVEWGEASILVQSTTTPGKVKITAEPLFKGGNTPIGCTVEFYTVPENGKMIYDNKLQKNITSNFSIVKQVEVDAKAAKERLKEVEKQQSDFGEK